MAELIEISVGMLVALVLATVLMTSCVWLGVAVVLYARDKTAARIDGAIEEMRAAASLVATNIGGAETEAYTLGLSDGWQQATEQMHGDEEEAV